MVNQSVLTIVSTDWLMLQLGRDQYSLMFLVLYGAGGGGGMTHSSQKKLVPLCAGKFIFNGLVGR